MMMMVGTSGVMQRLQCHGRKRSSQLFTRETETDGYNYHKIPHQMNMLMIIILCCIVSDNHKYYIQGQSHYFTCASYEPDPRIKPAHLLLCIFQYYSCNWNGRNIAFILGKLWVGKIWSARCILQSSYLGGACYNRGESGYQERKPPFQNRVRHCWNNSALSYFLLPASNMHSCQQLELTQAADLWINSAFAKHDLHEEGKENTNPLETAPLWEEMATMQKSIEMGSAAKTMLVFHVPKLSKVPLPPFNEPIASLSVRK